MEDKLIDILQNFQNDKSYNELNAVDDILRLFNVVVQSEQLKCDQACDWYSVGHQLNGHQECRTCGKQKAF